MMNNIVDSFKRVLKNKNTVTIIGVLAILVLLYIGYSSQIKSATKEIAIPVASQNIQPRTYITSDMVQTIDIPSIAVSEDVIRNSGLVVGKYSNVNSLIPKGSMFYKQTVINEEDLPDAAFVDLQKDEIAFKFPVDMESTYGNAMMPGSKINIYMKVSTDVNEKVMIGKLLTNIKILAVKDSSGKNVFENTETTRTPSMMIFGLKEKYWLLLSKAYYLRGEGIELFPVPATGSINTNGATEVSAKELEEYINARAIDVASADTNTTEVTDDLLPTVTETGGANNVVTITYPEGCGTTYVCKYKKDNEKEQTVSKKTTQNVLFKTNGTLIATVTESNGTVHTLNTNIPLTNTNSTSQAGNQ